MLTSNQLPDETATRSTGAKANIPKEQLTAYERWELASFDAPATGKPRGSEVLGKQQVQLDQQAYQQHCALGHEQGYAAGMQQAQAEALKINALLENLHGALHTIDEPLAQSLLDLALEVARQMSRVALQIQPEVILKIVTEAISTLPHFNQNPHLVLHPDDAELVRKHLGDQLANTHWKIFTDAQIQRGGCRIETAHSYVDATNAARWKHIVSAIGQDQSWLPL